MRIAMFYHSLLSDWNHGNAHFLRGVVAELQERGHTVVVYEPQDGWSLSNLIHEQGPSAVEMFHRAYPGLSSRFFDPLSTDLEHALADTDLVIVHEWNEPELVSRIGRLRRTGGRFRLLFHDTHHRAATAPESVAAYDLTDYDGVLAFGGVIRDIYLERGWASCAWTWHEAADTRVFRPAGRKSRQGDLVWVGNWGDDERSSELREFLLHPVKTLGLRARIHGVRYPSEARNELAEAGIEYAGWLPNYSVPGVFASHAVTVHVPRRPYAEALPGIPTIRVFEALACGIPLVSAPWDDIEGLFSPGLDYLVARDGQEMRCHLRSILEDPDMAGQMSRRGRETIMARHTCAHRVEELLSIYAEICGESCTESNSYSTGTGVKS